MLPRDRFELVVDEGGGQESEEDHARHQAQVRRSERLRRLTRAGSDGRCGPQPRRAEPLRVHPTERRAEACREEEQTGAEPEEVRCADPVRQDRHGESSEDVGERSARCDESEEPLPLLGGEEIGRERPELEQGDGSHHLHPDVERVVDPGSAAEQEPEQHDGRGHDQGGDDDHAVAADARTQPRHEQADTCQRERRPDVHPGQSRRGKVGEEKGVPD